ncbi:SUKH-3 domain-containing protein [Paenibacillus sp. Leaf72]|uniref:SUKH-3 domain-containing protein n=1 Tax=Paenibacillus sp. Leaf72 TaxID=1736234 RepID=UPI0006F7D5CE|nr:SUKH-3 domain-containing protein [Paenibacillus sp. Leaf72]KQO01108.1 hypothetical protein ASF12_14755 [Paenibacillus sp. Leaf72]
MGHLTAATLIVLNKAGWTPGRKIYIDSTVIFLENKNFEVFDCAKKVLEQFGGLKYLVPSDESDDFQIGPEFLRDGVERKHYARYEKIIGEPLVVIGLAYDENATMFISESGKIYGVRDDYYIWKFGDHIFEALNHLCEGRQLKVINEV